MSTITLTERRSASLRPVLVALAAIRFVVGIAAIPLAPLLYRDYFLLVVLMRPTKDVFLLGGFLARQNEIVIWALVLAAIPLSIFGVWLFYFLGRAYETEIESCELSGLAGRLLTPDRIKTLESALERKGPKLIFLGRLAVLSSAVVAAAAGAATMDAKRFLTVDLAGGLVSIGYTIGAGYLLGETYEKAGPWLTVVGAAALAAFSYILGRTLKREKR